MGHFSTMLMGVSKGFDPIGGNYSKFLDLYQTHLNLKSHQSENGQQIIFTVKNSINTGDPSTFTVNTNTSCEFKIVHKAIKTYSPPTITPPWRVILLLYIFHSPRFVSKRKRPKVQPRFHNRSITKTIIFFPCPYLLIFHFFDTPPTRFRLKEDL